VGEHGAAPTEKLHARRGGPWQASARVRVAHPSFFTNFTSGPPLVHLLSRLRFSLTFNVGLNP
jgi:hypothetical protein